MSGTPDGTEAKGLPDNGRDRTEAVLEKALPQDQQRMPATRENHAGRRKTDIAGHKQSGKV